MFNWLFGKKQNTSSSDSAWPFESPPNEAVITLQQITNGESPILLVVHDEDSVAWQFLTGEDISVEDSAVVSLRSISEIDPSIIELADLPVGWRAMRESIESPWQRVPS